MDIDVVILWVDGSDPNWLSEKRKYEKSGINTDDVYLYRDYGLMQYWFRAIESFLPWVRKIHFVTWGHLPSFLNLDNPKLDIVLHQDFMPEGTLPCFNSTALEMNIFRIKGLSEHFIYFNDDMFILRSMKRTDFFTEKGYPCCQFTESPPIHKGNRGPWQMHYVNGMNIINQHFQKKQCQRGNFNKCFNIKYPWYDNIRSLALKLLFPEYFTGFKTFHIPAPFCRKTFENIWNKEASYLTEVSKHRFRDYQDVNQWLAIWWQLAEGNFYPRRMNSVNKGVNRNSVDDVCELIKGQKCEMICINDDLDKESFPIATKKLQNAFNTILPHKCSFEL